MLLLHLLIPCADSSEKTLERGYLLARDRVKELSRETTKQKCPHFFMCTKYAYVSFVVSREGTSLLASPTSLRLFLKGSFGGAEGGKDSVRYVHKPSHNIKLYIYILLAVKYKSTCEVPKLK